VDEWAAGVLMFGSQRYVGYVDGNSCVCTYRDSSSIVDYLHERRACNARNK
jgi:hypothetical protein